MQRHSRDLLVLMLVIMALLMASERCLAAEPEDDGLDRIWDSSMEMLEGSGLTGPIDAIFSEISYPGNASWRELLSGILTGKGLNFKEFLAAVSQNALRNLFSQTRVLGKVILIGVVLACLDILSETLAPDGAGRIASWACQVSLILLAVFSFREVLTIAADAMETLRAAFFAFVPALTGLALVSGAPATAAALQPLVFAMGSVASVFVVDVAFPLIYTSIALDMAGSLTGEGRVQGIAGMLRQVASIGTGVLMACFVGVVAGQRAASSLADGMAFRTAKYLSSTFVPVAGKMIGDTMDLFFFAAYGLRAALGITGCLVILGAVFSPFLKVASCLVVWKSVSAVMGPVSGTAVRTSLKAMADGVSLLAMLLLVTSFVFIICVFLVSQAARPF